MAEAVLAHVGDARPVADLFAGIGTFTLRLARRARGDGGRRRRGAARGARRGRAPARAASGRSRARRRDLFANPLAPEELDALRRGGLRPAAPPAPRRRPRRSPQSRVPQVVAVSCNPATLARDARILIDGGYRLTRVLPVDQFLFSAEIEVVATFER